MCECSIGVNSLNLYEVSSLFVSVVIPIVVMIVTLFSEKIKHTKELKSQSEQFLKQISIMERQHTEELSKQDEANRIGIMPFLHISSVESRTKNDDLILSVKFKNSGMGIAANIRCIYLEDDTSYGSCLIHKSNTFKYWCYQPIDLYSNTKQINEECRVELIQERCEEYSELLNQTVGDEISLIVEYNDVKNNVYRQKFWFMIGNLEFDKEIHAYRKYSNPPELQ